MNYSDKQIFNPKKYGTLFVIGCVITVILSLLVTSFWITYSFTQREKSRSDIFRKQLTSSIERQYKHISEEAWTESYESIALRINHISNSIGAVAEFIVIIDKNGDCAFVTSKDKVNSCDKYTTTGSTNLIPSITFAKVDKSKNGQLVYKVKLEIANIELGNLTIFFNDPNNFVLGDGVLSFAINNLLMPLFIVFVLWFFWILYAKINIIAPYLYNIDQLKEKEVIDRQNAAIAKTTQMLAHDVRKPFSMIKSLLSILQSTKDISHIRKLISSFTPEVEKSISSVNGMISDIMEVGTNFSPITEAIDPRQIIISSLKEVFQFDEKSEISFSYQLNHSHTIEANQLKLLRVFSNITSNASEAIGGKGDIWFKTKDVDEAGYQFIEFTIGNNGGYIPNEEIGNLFEAFYTKGKKSGTGLGLAIAKKVIESHGGKIFCHSSKELGVEFVFTIPTSEIIIQTNSEITPASSQEITSSVKPTLQNHTSSLSSILKDELTIENELLQALKGKTTPLQVMVIDDEAIYRELITGMIETGSELSKKIIISAYKNSIPATKRVKEIDPEVVLMDVDLGQDSISGFEATKILRKNGISSKICIHSNRGAFEFQDEAISSGADLFLPKPISRHMFLKLLLSVVEAKESKNTNTEMSAVEKYIIVLDDNAMMLGAWEAVNQKKKLFFSPEEFYKELTMDADLLKNALCLITDQYFNEVDSDYTGLMFAKQLHGEGIQIPVFLSSDGEFSKDEFEGIIDQKISKIPQQAWDEISALIDVRSCPEA